MKRLLVAGSVFCVLLMGLLAVNAAQKGASFAGTWALDKSKSQLPERMQAIQGMTWTVTQDDKQITREQKIEGAMAGPGGGGGGRGMGGGGPLTLKLDGSESTSENPRGKTTSKVKWMDGGKILEVNQVANLSTPNGDFTVNTVEHWELLDGGKGLKVHQKRDTPQGAIESTLVFSKK